MPRPDRIAPGLDVIVAGWSAPINIKTKKVGWVGNSMADLPHLHAAIHQWPNSEQTSPMELLDVTVGLNPGENDSWNRMLKRWSPCEGYYVQSAR